MSEKFKPLAPGVFVAPQITVDEARRAAATLGVRRIINNRPDGEEAGQPPASEIEKAARDAGLDFVSIPVRMDNITDADIDAFTAALEGGPVLAYCRTGTRSTVLRALVRARAGDPIEAILKEAAAAGYDLAPLRPRFEALAPRQ